MTEKEHQSNEAQLSSKKNQFLDIRFENLNYAISKRGKGKKTILKSLNGEFRSGELTAIMGPSGAGKSTLMNVVAGFKSSNVSGTLLVNHQERDVHKFRKMSCYIMQIDDVCPVLTVKELMWYAVNLKIGNHLSSKAKKDLLDEILDTMGLTHTKGTRTANLSGGQKKRLAIALELINNPPVMFFDEPTTGLDSTSCFQCVSLMQRLARGGRTIICVIHQPSSSVFEMFDQLYLLAKGECIYQGPTTDVINFIYQATGIKCPSFHSPADFAIDVAAGNYGHVIDKLVDRVQIENHTSTNCTASTRKNFIHQRLEETSFTDEYNINDVKFSNGNDAVVFREPVSVSGWFQFWIILRKTIICIMRDKVLTGVRLGVQIVCGLLAGLIYWNIGNNAAQVFNNAGSIMFGQIILTCAAMMPTVITFPIEMNVLLREHLNNWHKLKVYFLAKSIADLPFEFIYPSVYIVMAYFMSGQPIEVYRFFMYWAMGILTSLVAQSVGIALGAALNLQAAVFMGPVTTVPLFLFSGFLITFTAIPSYLSWLCYIAYTRYGFEGTMLAVYGYDRKSLECPDAFCFFKSPVKVLQWMDMDGAVYWIDLVALLGYFFIIRFSAFFILRWKLKSRM